MASSERLLPFLVKGREHVTINKEIIRLLRSEELSGIPIITITIATPNPKDDQIFKHLKGYMTKIHQVVCSTKKQTATLHEPPAHLAEKQEPDDPKLNGGLLYIWSRPYIRKTPTSSNVAYLILSVDIGQKQSYTSNQLYEIALNKIITNVLAVKVKFSVTEDLVFNIEKFIEIGKAISTETCSSEMKYKFQKLMIVVDEWAYPKRHAYGLGGGKTFIEEFCQCKGSDRGRVSIRARNNIITSCSNLLGYLLRYAGPDSKYLEGSDKDLYNSELRTLCKTLCDIDMDQTKLHTSATLLQTLQNAMLKMKGKVQKYEKIDSFEALMKITNEPMVTEELKKIKENIIKEIHRDDESKVDIFDHLENLAKEGVKNIKEKLTGDPEDVKELLHEATCFVKNVKETALTQINTKRTQTDITKHDKLHRLFRVARRKYKEEMKKFDEMPPEHRPQLDIAHTKATALAFKQLESSKQLPKYEKYHDDIQTFFKDELNSRRLVSAKSLEEKAEVQLNKAKRLYEQKMDELYSVPSTSSNIEDMIKHHEEYLGASKMELDYRSEKNNETREELIKHCEAKLNKYMSEHKRLIGEQWEQSSPVCNPNRFPSQQERVPEKVYMVLATSCFEYMADMEDEAKINLRVSKERHELFKGEAIRYFIDVGGQTSVDKENLSETLEKFCNHYFMEHIQRVQSQPEDSEHIGSLNVRRTLSECKGELIFVSGYYLEEFFKPKEMTESSDMLTNAMMETFYTFEIRKKSWSNLFRFFHDSLFSFVTFNPATTFTDTFPVVDRMEEYKFCLLEAKKACEEYTNNMMAGMRQPHFEVYSLHKATAQRITADYFQNTILFQEQSIAVWASLNELLSCIFSEILHRQRITSESLLEALKGMGFSSEENTMDTAPLLNFFSQNKK